MDFGKSIDELKQFIGQMWDSEMRKRPAVYKPKFGLELLFLAWFPANRFVRRSLENVESLHDYVMAPYPGEIPYHDVTDKMSGSIRMLCFWINVNLLYRSRNHFLLFVKSVINYISHHVKQPSNAQTAGPDVSLVAENKGQVLSPKDAQVNPATEQNEKRSESDSSVKVPKEECTSSTVQNGQSLVADSGCTIW